MTTNRKLTLIIIPVLAIAVVAGGFIYYYQSKNNLLYPSGDTPVLPVTGFKAEIYSVTGNVIGVNGSDITLDAGIVLQGRDGKNRFGYVKRIVLVGDNTQIYDSGDRAALSDIKNGSELTIYTPDSPYSLNRLHADKIEIIK